MGSFRKSDIQDQVERDIMRRGEISERDRIKRKEARTLEDAQMERKQGKEGNKNERHKMQIPRERLSTRLGMETKEFIKEWPQWKMLQNGNDTTYSALCPQYARTMTLLWLLPQFESSYWALEHTVLLAVNAIWSLSLMRKEKHFKYVFPWRSLLNRLKVSVIGWKK